MKTPHKLAAVLFADITGYTAMMSENEELALENLNIFKSTIESVVPLHFGKVIQYFGDGCLCTFDSSINAVECAEEIQNTLLKGIRVPVRIGIHTGDVVFKEGNVYGNSVNIASRIESIGQPGTILVSGPVRNQVKSSGIYKFTSLGHFEFKNVDEPIQVYALSNRGFIVPAPEIIEGKLKIVPKTKKKLPHKILWTIGLVLLFILWYLSAGTEITYKSPQKLLKTEGIVLLDFINKTNDSNYDYLRCEIYDKLSALFKANKINVHNNSWLCTKTMTLEEMQSSGNNLERYYEEKYGIQGSYSIEQDSLVFLIKIFRTLTNSPLFNTIQIRTPVNKHHFVSIEHMVSMLGQWWELPEVNEPTQKYASPEWLAAYERAIYYLEKDFSQALEQIDICKELDSTQYRADLLAVEIYKWIGDSRADSLISTLKSRVTEFSEDEKNLFNYLIALHQRDYPLAIEYYKKAYENDTKNLFTNFTMISNLVQLVNRSDEAIKVGEEIPYEMVDYNDCLYCRDRISIWARALIDKKRYDEALNALEYTQSMETDMPSLGNMEMQIRALVRKNDDEKLRAKVEETKFKNYQRDYAYFLYIAAYEYHLAGDSVNTRKYYELHQQEVVGNTSFSVKSRNGRMQIFLKEYDLAAQSLKGVPEYYAQMGWIHFFDGYYGYALAREGRTSEALAIIEKMEETKSILENEWEVARIPYYQAQVYAGLRDTENALKYLKESLTRGKRFYRWEFQYDPLFTELMENKEFKELIYNL